MQALQRIFPYFWFAYCTKQRYKSHITGSDPTGSLEEHKQCTLHMGGNGSLQDRGHTPSVEYCHFKYILNITRSEQAEVHKPKELNFDHLIKFEKQIGI